MFKAHNQDVFEIMLSFVDFATFKKRMVSFRREVENDHKKLSDNEGSTTTGGSEGKSSTMMHIDDEDFATFERLMAEDVNDKSIGWKKVIDQKMSAKSNVSIVMYQRKQPGKSDICRAVTVWKDFNMLKFTELAMDPTHLKQGNTVFMNSVEEIDENTKIWHGRSKMPLMTDRETLLKFKRMPRPDGSVLFSCNSVERDDVPHAKDAIRMEMFKMSHATQVGPDMHLTEFSSFDMKGSFPMRLMNMVMGAMASKGMTRIYDEFKKSGC